MQFGSEQMGQLKSFGFSAYAARAYLALLRLGVAEARGVSELAGIPTAKVYGTLEQLQRRGLAQVTLGKPRKYAPVPMEEFIERQLQEQEEQLASLRARREELVRLFPVLGTTTEVAGRAHMTAIAGRRNVMQRFREACMATEEDVFVAAPAELLGPDGPVGRLLEQARARGVRVHVVPGVSGADREALATAHAPLPADAEPAAQVTIATFDERTALFLRLSSEAGHGARAKETAICTGEVAFVRSLRALLALQCAHAHAAQGPCATLAAADVEAHVRARVHEGARFLDVVVSRREDAFAAHGLWRTAARDGVRARILLNMDMAAALALAGDADLSTHVQFRQVERPGMGCFAILDARHAVFLAGSSAAYATTSDATLVRAFDAQFEAGWAQALPFHERDEPRVGARTLPHSLRSSTWRRGTPLESRNREAI